MARLCPFCDAGANASVTKWMESSKAPREKLIQALEVKEQTQIDFTCSHVNGCGGNRCGRPLHLAPTAATPYVAMAIAKLVPDHCFGHRARPLRLCACVRQV